MQTRFLAFIATSVDGYIADANGSIEWLETANKSVPTGEDCGYNDFIARVDAIVMGRKTFEQVCRFSEWPYGTLPVIVLSRSLKELPGGVPDTAELHNLPTVDLASMLSQRGFRNVYVDGGATIQGFLSASLLNEITITSIPILLGRGIPLFGDLTPCLHLKLNGSKAYPFGFVQNSYTVSTANPD